MDVLEIAIWWRTLGRWIYRNRRYRAIIGIAGLPASSSGPMLDLLLVAGRR